METRPSWPSHSYGCSLIESFVGARVVPNLHASSSELSAGGSDTIVDDALLSYFRILGPIKVAKLKYFQAVIPHRQDKRARSPVYINIGISTHIFSTELPQSTPGPHLDYAMLDVGHRARLQPEPALARDTGADRPGTRARKVHRGHRARRWT